LNCFEFTELSNISILVLLSVPIYTIHGGLSSCLQKERVWISDGRKQFGSKEESRFLANHQADLKIPELSNIFFVQLLFENPTECYRYTSDKPFTQFVSAVELILRPSLVMRLH